MAPTIYDRSESGLSDNASPFLFGGIGDIYAVTVHHSAGPRATSKARCQQLNRSYQLGHISKGWGDIGYHACMDDLGRFYKLRPVGAKGAHVGGWNTGNLGLMVHGNYMHDELYKAQRESLEWLFKGGFLKLFGVREREVDLARGHQEWPGHGSNACPGTNLMRHWRWRRGVSLDAA